MFIQSKKWPHPKYDEGDQPHFLFIITPPFSGSTALSELLNSSHSSMILQPRGEGQWLLPGLCAKDRWMPHKKVDYDSVKAVWLRKYQEVKRLTQNIDLVIEKSPPNMMRIQKLSSQFSDYSFIANNRNPYASCASILFRKHDAENIGADKRKKAIVEIVNNWLIRSSKIQDLVSRLKIPLLTYEQFCDNPSSVLDRLSIPLGVSQTIDTNANVKVKDYEPQPIINQNERQISRLTDEEVEQISQMLACKQDLLEYFGYQSLS